MSFEENAEHNVEEAAVLLRLALPLMTRHGVAATPQNYAVWYAYVEGANIALKEAIDRRIASGEAFDSDFNRMLHRRHVLEASERALEEMRVSVRALIDGISDTVDTADKHFGDYVQRLDHHGAKLEQNPASGELLDLVRNLAEETREARVNSQQLQEHLAQSRRDSEEMRRELDRLHNEATTDALTGLANRRALLEAVREAKASAGADGRFTVLFADIDHFKKINDRYGHLLGDKVLRYVASVIKRSVKGGDTAARYGGEEFVLVLPDTGYEGGLALAENLRRTVEVGRLVRSDTRERIGAVTISFGIAEWRSGESQETLFERADACLYLAKKLGRNRVLGERDEAFTTAA